MGAAYFYHLTESPLEAVLPGLIERARGAGWRVEVRGPEDVVARLDEVLWTRPPDGFLPHGRAGGPHDALQPVILCGPGQAAGNAASCVMAVGGAGVAAEEVAAADRVCVLFDGHDGAAVAAARVQWKALTGAGCAAQYWAQEGGWKKKAEAGG